MRMSYSLLMMTLCLFTFPFPEGRAQWAEGNQSHFLGKGNVQYLITDRGPASVSEIYGFTVPDPFRPGVEAGRYYQERNSNAEYGKDYFSQISLVDCLKGKVVLDLASGGGLLVKGLRSHGIDAHGIDLRPPSPQHQCVLNHPILDPDHHPEAPYALQRGDVSETPYPDGSFDRILSTWGPFSYFNGKTRGEQKEALLELFDKTIDEIIRVLKPGGMALIGPLVELHITERLPFNVFDVAAKKSGPHTQIFSYRGIGRRSYNCSYCPYLILTKGPVSPDQFCAH